MFNNNIKNKKILKAKSELQLNKLIKANEMRWDVIGHMKFIPEDYYNPFQILLKLKDKELLVKDKKNIKE